MILLDTNVVIWVLIGDPRVGEAARRALDDDPVRYCSTMVQWELGMLAAKGRLALGMPVAAWLERARALLRFSDVAVSGAIALDAAALPGALHGDPCDRIMIATARALGCPLLTTDRAILGYASDGHLRAIDAGR